MDDTTLYACGKNLDSISNKIDKETNAAIKGLRNNEIVANPSKFVTFQIQKL